MKICVLGAGVTGLTTAWRLAEAGHNVIVVDRHPSTGADASAANGRPAQLQFRGAAGFPRDTAETAIAVDVARFAGSRSASP